MHRNMNRELQRKRGAVLGLVVVSALVLAILGVGFIFLIMQLGGGQELQHATDSGNLNVAKQVLRHPGIKLDPNNPDEKNIFGDTIDPETNEVNLLYYNRLVAQALLIQNNANVLKTSASSAHSSQMMDLVNGIAGRLNDQLVSPGNFDKHFHDTAQNHAMRMFEAMANSVSHVGQNHEVSHMARGAATNVHIADNQILRAGSNPIPAINDFTVPGPNGKLYLVGYKQLTVNNNKTLWGVPLRPSQPPHLVADKNFVSNQPRGPIPLFVPPNSFKSAGLTKDQRASNLNTRALSSSIVGSLQKTWQASIPRGVIIVDNKGAFCGSVTTGKFDIWTDKLMDPNYIEVLGPTSATGLISDSSNGALQDVKSFVDSNYNALIGGDTAAQNQLANKLGNAGIDSWGDYPSDPNGNSKNKQFIEDIKSWIVTRCNNKNTKATNDLCNLGKFMSLYNENSGGGTSHQDCNLMAVEKYHVDLCTVRATGADCAEVRSQNAYSGLKAYPITGNCGLTKTRIGTLAELMGQTNVAQEVSQQLTTYMYQINPEAPDIQAQIANVFNSPVLFDKISYIYRNPNNNTLVLSTQLPPWPLPDLSIPGTNLPDGPEPPKTPIYTRAFSMDPLTNCDGECGYPHPWDCPMGSLADGMDWAEWQPSSGFKNILGVLKFRNRASGGGTFCCPC